MKSQKGFTLIELLVVIAIIGILSSVVLASLNTARTKARDARRIADIGQLKLALELYADDHFASYPADATWSTDLTGGGYIAVVPNDPTGVAYTYEVGNPTTSYCLGVDLEDENNSATTTANAACVTSLGLDANLGYAVSN